MIYNNGDVYDRTWKNDKKYNGLMKYKNGDEYEGECVNNNQFQRIMKYNNGDKFNGLGKIIKEKEKE